MSRFELQAAIVSSGSVDLDWKSVCGQFRNKITFIPKLRGHVLTPNFGTDREYDRWARGNESGS